jgi:hypothetical protein
MKKSLLIAAICLAFLSGIAAIVYKPWQAPKLEAPTVELAEPQMLDANKALLPDFQKIVEFYSSPSLGFHLIHKQFQGEGYSTQVLDQEMDIAYGQSFYQSISANQVMVCNSQVSALIDKEEHSIYLDSAWDLQQLLPTKGIMEALMATYDTITKTTLATGQVQYRIPAINGNPLCYSLLTINPGNSSIASISIYSLEQIGNTLDDVVPIHYQFTYSAYTTSPQANMALLNTSSYIAWQQNKLVSSAPYANYTVYYKNETY